MKILVTGSEGYVAAHLKRKMADHFTHDFQLVTLDQSEKFSGTGGSIRPHISSCIADLASYGDHLHDVTHVIHLADLRLQYYSNENLPQQVLKQKKFFAALENLPLLEHVLVASSCSVYGWAEDPIDEDSKVNPTSLYAEAKLHMEDIVRKSDLPFSIFRFGTAYGGDLKLRYDLFVNQLIQKVTENEPMEVFGLNAWRPYVHVEDFASCLLHFLNQPQNRVINVAESNHNKINILNLIKQQWGHLQSVELREDKPDFRNYFVRNELVKALGHEFNYSMSRGIKEMVASHAISNRARAHQEARVQSIRPL